MDKTEHENPEVQLAAVAEQSRSNSEQIGLLRKELAGFAERITNVVEQLSERVNRSGNPNWQAWGVAVSVVVALGALVAFGFQSEISAIKENVVTLSSENRQGTMALDAKLQREQLLLTAEVKSQIESVNTMSKERHNDAQRQIDVLQSWLTGQVAADLQELRQRRMGDDSQQKRRPPPPLIIEGK